MWGWHAEAVTALHELALKQPLLTSDDLHGLVAEPTNANKWGAVFDVARKIGFIQPTKAWTRSRRSPSRHRQIQIWQSRCFQGLTFDDPEAAYREQQGQGETQLTLQVAESR